MIWCCWVVAAKAAAMPADIHAEQGQGIIILISARLSPSPQSRDRARSVTKIFRSDIGGGEAVARMSVAGIDVALCLNLPAKRVCHAGVVCLHSKGENLLTCIKNSPNGRTGR